jgi:hypothetical protein
MDESRKPAYVRGFLLAFYPTSIGQSDEFWTVL